MLKSVAKAQSKAKAGRKIQAKPKAAKPTKRSAKKVAVQKRSFSTILTGTEDWALPKHQKKPAASAVPEPAAVDAEHDTMSQQQNDQQPSQQQQQQQQQMPQLDFNDPQVTQSISAWNSFIRAKTAPIFQQSFQHLLVAHKVIPSPTDEDFVNPVPHIRKGLLKHGLLFESTDERTLPDDITALQRESDAKNKDKSRIITPTSLFRIIDFFQILNPQNEAELEAGIDYKPGLANQFIPFKPGEYETDPTNFNHEAVKNKLKANQRLGLDATTIEKNSVLDIVAFCAEAAGGIDLMEYVVTQNRPNSHAIFLEYLRAVPPTGDLLTSDFSDNIAAPFSPRHLHMFPDLAQSLNQITTALDNENSPQKLLQFSVQVSRSDIFAVWKKQNPELSSRFLQCGLNPLVGFNEEELINVKGMILKQFIQNVLVNKYLFAPFQTTFYSANGEITGLQTQEEFANYFNKKRDALAGILPDDPEDVQMRKRAARVGHPEAIGRMSQLTDSDQYKEIHGGKTQLLIQNLPKTQDTALTARFTDELMKQGFYDMDKLRQQYTEQSQGAPPTDTNMMQFIKSFIMDTVVVKTGVLTKRTKVEGEDDAPSEKKSSITGRPIVNIRYGKNIGADILSNIDDLNGVKVTDPDTNETILVKTFEQEVVARLKRFGLLDHGNQDAFEITTLTPLSFPQDPEHDKAFKQKINDKKLLPINVAGMTVPTVPGSKPDPNQISPYIRLLLAASMADRNGGDNDPNSSTAIPIDEEELAKLSTGGLIEPQPGADMEHINKMIDFRAMVRQKLSEGVRPEDIELDKSITGVHVVSRPQEDAYSPMKGWVRSLENDLVLAEGTMVDVDRAIFKMDLNQLRDFTARQFNHDIAMFNAQEDLDLFTTFTRDIHTRSFPEPEMNSLRFMASQMATQSILKSKFRENMDMVDAGTIPPEELVYHHVLFTTPDELKQSKQYFLDKTRFDKIEPKRF